MSTTPQNPDVVIVGAGPVGLVAACELARRGVTFRIIDKLRRADGRVACDRRSIRAASTCSTGWGSSTTLLATGVKSTSMRMLSSGNQLFQVTFGGVDSAFPFTLLTAQTETERVLTERLEQLGVTVDRGVELVELTQDDDVATLGLRRPDGSAEHVTTLLGRSPPTAPTARPGTWSEPSWRARSRASGSSWAIATPSTISTARIDVHRLLARGHGDRDADAGRSSAVDGPDP